ncbi:copper resistance protein CopC [Leucobacter soli]|uniref:CopC domain-containing protein n=1 Tax=Leucobacter soli TaxID=2812850 RepID=A0A916JSV4_9MICO|nr:copper resistance CopC family protein [Leucobacter soli]CAG7598272.1 hypothetical protein LEUCIP111803_00209 [Leucobacter soli]
MKTTTMHTNMHTNTPTRPRTVARTLAAGLIAAGAALALTLGASSPALAHDEITGYRVDIDEATGNADRLTLSFSNDIMDVGSEILITDADEQEVADGAPEVDGRDVVQRFAADIGEGMYRIAWRVVSSDGHPIQGLLVFRLDADGLVSWLPADDDGTAGEGTEAPAPADETDSHGDEQGEEHDEGHEHEHDGDASADTATSSGLGAGSIAAVVIGAGVVVAGGVAAVIVGSRRRARAMNEAAAGAASDTDESATNTDESAPNADDAR